jgi:hypothetical protein
MNSDSTKKIIQSTAMVLAFLRDYSSGDGYPEENLGCRIIFRFPDNVIVSYLANGHFLLYKSDGGELTGPMSEDWRWDEGSGARISISRFVETEIGDVLEMFAQSLGKAEIVLPWNEILSTEGPAGESHRDGGFEELYFDEEEVSIWESSLRSLEILFATAESEFQSSIISGLSFAPGDSLLPKKCKYLRFESFLENLEERGWIYADSSSDRVNASKDVANSRNSSPEKRNAPALIGYPDINNPSFLPSGDMLTVSFIVDSQSGTEDLRTAADYQLTTELSGNSFTIF